jgi:hypothetical protein
MMVTFMPWNNSQEFNKMESHPIKDLQEIVCTPFTKKKSDNLS